MRLLTFLLLAINFSQAFAQGGGCNLEDANSATGFACVLSRVIAVAVGLAAIILVAMIAWGAIKLAMATGDPKGFSGAKTTWEYAAMGFMIIFLVAAVFSIIGSILGINVLDLNGMVGALESGLNDLFQFARSGS